MLASLSPKLDYLGIKLKIANGSKLFKEIRKDILFQEDYKFQEATIPALYIASLTAARSIIERITYNY